MSIQSEITRITNNVQDTIDVIEQTGVSVPDGANSDDLPSLALALSNTKQDKLTGTKGQLVGFDDAGNAVAQAAPETGVVTFNGRTGTVSPQVGDYTADMVGARPSTWTPSAADVGAVPTSRTVNGHALSNNVTLNAVDVGAVPTTRTINSKPLSSNVTLTAADVGAGTPATSTTVTLTATGWTSSQRIGVPGGSTGGGSTGNQQTVTVQGVLADESKQLIQPMPAIASQEAYMAAGVYCSGQAANSLTFTCTTTPTENLTVYVVIQGVSV